MREKQRVAGGLGPDQLGDGRTRRAGGREHGSADFRATALAHGPRRGYTRLRNTLKDDAKADGKRNVASLFRLCLEASFWRLPERGGKQAVELEATLKDDGSVTLEVSGDAPAEVAECLRGMGPKILARAPSSIRAHVELGTARQTWGGMDGVLGGLAGGSTGGTGEGTIGIGSFGLRGQGAGAGAGHGRGAKPPKAKAANKK